MKYTAENPDPDRDIYMTDGGVLPKEIGDLAKKFYDKNTSYRDDKHYTLSRMFIWDSAKGGVNWLEINMGNYSSYYLIYPKSVDNFSII